MCHYFIFWIAGVREDVGSSELWFDAEEDLRHPEPAAEIELDPDSTPG